MDDHFHTEPRENPTVITPEGDDLPNLTRARVGGNRTIIGMLRNEIGRCETISAVATAVGFAGIGTAGFGISASLTGGSVIAIAGGVLIAAAALGVVTTTKHIRDNISKQLTKKEEERNRQIIETQKIKASLGKKKDTPERR